MAELHTHLGCMLPAPRLQTCTARYWPNYCRPLTGTPLEVLGHQNLSKHRKSTIKVQAKGQNGTPAQGTCREWDSQDWELLWVSRGEGRANEGLERGAQDYGPLHTHFGNTASVKSIFLSSVKGTLASCNFFTL